MKTVSASTRSFNSCEFEFTLLRIVLLMIQFIEYVKSVSLHKNN